MKRLSKKNCGIIYAVKLNQEGDKYKSIATFMSKYTDTPIEYYTKAILETLLSHAIADLLDNLKYPSSFWFNYWRWKHFPWDMNDFDAICATLTEIAVKDENGNYINGFMPLEDFYD